MMKIPHSLRDKYTTQISRYEPLEVVVDDFMNHHKHRQWHYESRLKPLESFALKVESGRRNSHGQMEDFFACMLVVNNLASMAEAEKLVRNKFKFYERRPKSDQLPRSRLIVFASTIHDSMLSGKMILDQDPQDSTGSYLRFRSKHFLLIPGL